MTTIEPKVIYYFWRVVLRPKYFISIFMAWIGEIQTSESFLICYNFILAQSNCYVSASFFIHDFTNIFQKRLRIHKLNCQQFWPLLHSWLIIDWDGWVKCQDGLAVLWINKKSDLLWCCEVDQKYINWSLILEEHFMKSLKNSFQHS